MQWGITDNLDVLRFFARKQHLFWNSKALLHRRSPVFRKAAYHIDKRNRCLYSNIRHMTILCVSKWRACFPQKANRLAYVIIEFWGIFGKYFPQSGCCGHTVIFACLSQMPVNKKRQLNSDLMQAEFPSSLLLSGLGGWKQGDPNDVLLKTVEIKQQLGATFGHVFHKYHWPHPQVVQIAGAPLSSVGCVGFSWDVQALLFCHFLKWLFMHQKAPNQNLWGVRRMKSTMNLGAASQEANLVTRTC